MDFEVFRAREHLPAAGERTREGLLPGVNSDVVDQFVLRFERLALARTFLPEADVRALLGSPDVLHGDVVDQLVHGAVRLRAGLLLTLLRLDPLAYELLLDGLSHVPQESPRGSVRSGGDVDIEVHGVVAVQRGRSVVVLRPVPEVLRPAVDVPRQTQAHLPVEGMVVVVVRAWGRLVVKSSEK